MIIGRDLVNEYYEDEKLYSTGDEDLDDLLERAFCEGYEYAQHEYSKKKKKNKKKKDKDEDRKSLSSYGSGRGYGRGIAISAAPGVAIMGTGGAIGGATAGRMLGDSRTAVKGGIVGGLTGAGMGSLGGIIPGVTGVAVGSHYANKADEEGKSDAEIVRAAKRAGAISGAAGGALSSGAASLISGINNKKKYGIKTNIGREILTGALNTGLGALGGMAGAAKNTRARLKKRSDDED